MEAFSRKIGVLHAEGVNLEDVALQYGTPTYVYSRSYIQGQWRRYEKALGLRDSLICYAVKANSNMAILNLLAKLGSGFDIVSIGELERVIHAGGDPSKIVFSGVGKGINEIQRALQVGICCFNVESEAELERIQDVAKSINVRAHVSVRINPDVDACVHPHVTTGLRCNKFGIGIDEIPDVCARVRDSMSHVKIVGLGFHIGSQLTTLLPFDNAFKQALGLIVRLKDEGFDFGQIDVGGGLGIAYKHDDAPPTIEEYVRIVLKYFSNQKLRIILEPGRSIVGNAGVLLTRVEYIKPGQDGRHFVIVDAAMNDILRPALYDAWHDVVPVTSRTERPFYQCDVVGPICESADVLAKNRYLPASQGDLLAICGVGAYGFSLSSQYNSRPRAAEVMVDGEILCVVRERETVETLMQGEHMLE